MFWFIMKVGLVRLRSSECKLLSLYYSSIKWDSKILSLEKLAWHVNCWRSCLSSANLQNSRNCILYSFLFIHSKRRLLNILQVHFVAITKINHQLLMLWVCKKRLTGNVSRYWKENWLSLLKMFLEPKHDLSVIRESTAQYNCLVRCFGANSWRSQIVNKRESLFPTIFFRYKLFLGVSL